MAGAAPVAGQGCMQELSGGAVDVDAGPCTSNAAHVADDHDVDQGGVTVPEKEPATVAADRIAVYGTGCQPGTVASPEVESTAIGGGVAIDLAIADRGWSPL